MLLYPIVFAVFLVSIPVLTLVVGGRLIWCAFHLSRSSHYKLAAVSAVAVIVMGALLVLVTFAWFEYGVAPMSKDFWTDLRMDLLTGIPFYAAFYGLWRLGAYLQSVVDRTRPLSGYRPPPGTVNRVVDSGGAVK